MQSTFVDMGVRDGLVNAQVAQPLAAANYLRNVNATGTLTVAEKAIANGHVAQPLPTP
jgi:hypothetical protein